MGHCVVLSVVFPSIFLCGLYSVCGGGNSQARFWVLIVSIHSAEGIGFFCVGFSDGSPVRGRVCLVHGALCHPLGRFFSVYLSVGSVVSAVVEIPKHGFGS